MTHEKTQALMNEINAAFKSNVLTTASDPNYEVTCLPTGLLPIDLLLHGGLPRGRFVEIYGDFCVTPDTKILTDALSWAPAGEVVEGYGLVGFDERVKGSKQGHSAKLMPSEVEATGMKKLQCVRIITDKGEITCSVGHGLVGRHRTQKSRTWFRAGDLVVGDSLVWTAEPWDLKNDRDAGYIAGLFDGEGWIDGSRVSFGQNPGIVLDRGIDALKRLGFTVTVQPQSQNEVMRVSVTGGRFEAMKLIGQCRPYRMLENSPKLWVGKGLVNKGPFCEPGSGQATVLAVEFVGKQDVVTLQTSSKTYIANGFPSHNSTLKSYVGYRAIAETQRNGGICALIDTERSFDPAWAESIGVDVSQLLMPNRNDMETGEQAIDMAETLVRTKQVDLIVVDSIAAMLPQAERKKRLHDESNQPGRLAALMSLACRKITAANGSTSVLWVNQTRMNIGITFGSPVTTSGGKAMGFYASYRLSCKKTGKITRDIQSWDGTQNVNVKEQVGQKIKISVEKSKLSRPFRDVNLIWDYENASIDIIDFLTSYGVEKGLIGRQGNTWTYEDISSIGRTNFKKKLKARPELLAKMEQEALSSVDRKSSVEHVELSDTDDTVNPVVKRKRGRPKKGE